METSEARPAAKLQIQMFGGLRLLNGSVPSDRVAPQKAAALLAFLACHQDRSHPREALIDLLWPDADLDTGRVRLRTTLSDLRKYLAAAAPSGEQGADALLLADRASVRLNAALLTTDRDAFEAALRAAAREARTGNAGTREGLAEQARHLSEAVALYRGELLPGLYDDWAVAERERCAHLFRVALRTLAECQRDLGRPEESIQTLRRAVREDPLCEEANGDLIRLYLAAGRTVEARRQYQALEAALREELGVEPSPEVRRLLVNGTAAAPVASAPSPARNGTSYGVSHEAAAAAAAPPAGSAPIASPSPEAPADQPAEDPPDRRAGHRWSIAAAAALALALAIVFAFVLPPRLPARKAPPVPQPPAADAAPAEVTPLWVARYAPGPGEQDSEPTAVACGGDSSIYVAGFVRTAPAMRRDVDFLAVKYDSNGREVWRATYDGPGHDVDRARCILLDPRGFVYVAGESDNGKGNGTTRLAGTDFAIVKLDATIGKASPTWPDVGDGVGVRRYNGPDDGADTPIRMALDNDGSVYVLGSSYGRGKSGKAGLDFALVKYDRGGARKWVTRYDGGQGHDEPTNLGLDTRDGALWAVGVTKGEPASGPERDWLTLKVAAVDGRILWARRYGEGNHADDCARYLSIEGGSVWVVGEARGAPGTPDAHHMGATVVHYNALGEIEAVRGTTGESDRIEVVGPTYVGGGAAGWLMTGLAVTPNGSVWRTVLRDGGGFPRWSRDVTGQTEPPSGMVSSSHGIFVFGAMPSTRGDMDLGLVKYDWAGNLEWTHRYDGAQGMEKAGALTADPQGHPLVVGQSAGAREADLVVIKYAP